MAAMDSVTARCMADHGFRYVPIDVATAEAESAATIANRRADLPYDSAVEGASYALPRKGPPRTFDNDAYVRGLAPSEQSAWGSAALGDPEDAVEIQVPQGTLSLPRKGCLTEGRVKVFGSLENAAQFLAGLANFRTGAIIAALAEPAVSEALGEWRTCVHSRTGRDFESFDQARQYAYDHAADAQSIAGADSDCTGSSALGSTFSAAFQRQLDQAINDNIGELEGYTEGLAVALANAKAVLSNG
jgi:hypothetical protein